MQSTSFYGGKEMTAKDLSRRYGYGERRKPAKRLELSAGV
jgi:hypothetical protein